MEQRHLTLMFTDIVGYSRLMGRDQVQTIAMLEDYRRILVEEIDKHDGTVVEFIGDAVFARFDTPLAGVKAAVAIQKALFAFNHFRDKSLPPLQTRIGLHSGEVATKDDAFFGDDVNIAARLEPVAVADSVCISEQVYREIKAHIHEPVLALGALPLKNIESKIRGYLIRPLGITLGIRSHYINRRIKEKLGAYRYAIAASVLCLIVAGIYFIPRWLVPGYDANYVEIADFKMLTNGDEANYLSSGISEAVRAQLADMKDVYVLKSGEGVQAPVVLDGSVQRFGQNLRVAYQIKRRDGDVQIAGGKLDGKYDEIFILQDRLVGEIAKYLAEEFRIPNFRPAKLTSTSNTLAYDYYLRGMEIMRSPDFNSSSDEAIKYFTTALVHDNTFADAEAALCAAYRANYSYSSDAEWLTGAKEHCEAALKLEPGHTQALSSMGSIYWAQGKYEEAAELLSGVLVRDPNNVIAASHLAKTYDFTGQKEKAELVLKEIVGNRPKDWVAHSALAYFYLLNGRYPEAIAKYRDVLELTPVNSGAYSNMGVAYSIIGKLDESTKAFEKAVSITPSSYGYSNVGINQYYLGDYEKAAETYQLALKLNRQDYVLNLNYADTLRQLKRPDDEIKHRYRVALDLAKKFYELNNNDPFANLSLAMCYLALGEMALSYQHITKALEVAPSDPTVLYGRLRYEIANNDMEKGLSTLKIMLEQGYSPVLIEKDPDLSTIREMAEYQRMVAQLDS